MAAYSSSARFQRQATIASGWADASKSNAANVRLAQAHAEPQFAHAGAQVGTQIWRIESFELVPWLEENYGEFFRGDSYLLLNTYGSGTALFHDIYFWIGSESTQDEYGTAAIKAVELDDALGGGPVQHREVEGFESENFLALFPGNCIQLLDGGVESGFNHVEPEEYVPRLLHLKGTANSVRVQQAPMVRASLNSGDVFVLDAGLRIWQLNGGGSSGHERIKAAQLCRALNDERSGRPEVIVIDESAASDAADFWALLGGAGPIATAAEGGDDATAAIKEGTKRLYRLSDASGAMQFTEVATGALSRSQLDSADVFIVDTGKEVFAWVGSGASANERRQALTYAQRYLTETSRPVYLPITRVVEGRESPEFVANFGDFGAAAAAAASTASQSRVQALSATFNKPEFAGASGFFSAEAVSSSDTAWMRSGEVSSEGKKKKDKKAKKREKKELKKKKKGKDKKDKGKDKDKKDKKDKSKNKDKKKDKKDKKDKKKDKKKK
jgi:gelsolin